jgi:hypothetical protein
VARSYSRDGSGRFATAGSKGGGAKTVQQASQEKKREQRAAKERLSGGKLGGRKTKRVSRTKALGRKASTKAMKNSLARAKARFT